MEVFSISNFRKYIDLDINPKKLAIFFFLVYVVLIIPIIYIGKYDKPCADDYGYGAMTHHAWIKNHSLSDAWDAIVLTVKENYNIWQGTFSSIFMMALNPAAFDYRLYKLVPVLIVSILSLACFGIAKVLLKDILKRDNAYWIIVGASLSILTIEKMHAPSSGIYYYNAAVHYVFMHSLLILMLSTCVKMVNANRVWEKIVFVLLSMILAVAVGGSNYATCLMGLILLLSVGLIMGFFVRKKALICVFPIVANAICFVINIVAPGNAIRQGYFEGMSAVHAIFYSFKSAAIYIVDWMDIFTVLLLILLVPVFTSCFKNVKFRFPMPGIVLIYSFCILATGFTASFYSMGNSGVERLHNVVKITYQILLVLNEAYFIGWLEKRKWVMQIQIPLWSVLLVVVLMSASVLYLPNSAQNFTTYQAMNDLKNGKAAMYYQEYMERRMILEHNAGMDIVLQPYEFRPALLFVDDITNDTDDWRNRQLAYWYRKNSVVLDD